MCKRNIAVDVAVTTCTVLCIVVVNFQSSGIGSRMHMAAGDLEGE